MIRDLFNIIVVIPILMGLCVIAIFATKYAYKRVILTPSFFETTEEIAWAREMTSKKVDFYNEPWAKQSTITISEDKREYASPTKRYKFTLKWHHDYKDVAVGFYITDTKTGMVVLDSQHFVIHPSEVKWLFKEKYVAYLYDEEDMLGLHWEYVYVGSLKTGEIAKLTTREHKIYKSGSL